MNTDRTNEQRSKLLNRLSPPCSSVFICGHSTRSQGGDDLAGDLVADAVGVPAAQPGEEPVRVPLAVQRVHGVVVVHRGRRQQVALVQAAALRAIEVVDPRLVVHAGVGPAPLGQDRVQGHEGAVEVRRAADEDVVAAVAAQQVGAQAADEQVAAGPRLQLVVPRAALQDVVGAAALGVEDVVAVVAEQEGGDRDVHGGVVDHVGLQLEGIVARLAVHEDMPGREEVAQGGRADLDVDAAGGVGRFEDDGIRAGRAADGQGSLGRVERVGLQGHGRDRVRGRGGGAGALVLVRGGNPHRVAAAGGVDVAHRGARGAGDRLRGTVAPGDSEGEAGRLVHTGRVGGREGEGAGLAADAVGGAGHARGRGHVVYEDGRVGGRAGGAVLVGGGQGHNVGAIVVGREGNAGRAARGVGAAVLGDPPGVAEAGGGVHGAVVGGGGGRAGGGPGRAVDGGGGAGHGRCRGDVVHEDGRVGGRAGGAVLIGGGQGHDVGAVIVRREAEIGGAARGVGAAVLGDAPGVAEAGGGVLRGWVGDTSAVEALRRFV